jgi:hypothetical protein
MRVPGQHVVGREHVAQIGFSRDRRMLRVRAGMSGEIEGETDTTQRRDLSRARRYCCWLPPQPCTNNTPESANPA